jgi:hypothetical protein
MRSLGGKADASAAAGRLHYAGCFCVKMAAAWLCRYGAWEDRRDLAAGAGRPFRPGLLRRNGNASGLDH